MGAIACHNSGETEEVSSLCILENHSHNPHCISKSIPSGQIIMSVSCIWHLVNMSGEVSLTDGSYCVVC